VNEQDWERNSHTKKDQADIGACGMDFWKYLSVRTFINPALSLWSVETKMVSSF